MNTVPLNNKKKDIWEKTQIRFQSLPQPNTDDFENSD